MPLVTLIKGDPVEWTDKKLDWRGAWVGQSVKCLTLALVMILHFVSSSPASGSVLTARSLEPASESVSPSLSVSDPPPLMLALSLSLSVSQESTLKKIKKKKKLD